MCVHINLSTYLFYLLIYHLYITYIFAYHYYYSAINTYIYFLAYIKLISPSCVSDSRLTITHDLCPSDNILVDSNDYMHN